MADTDGDAYGDLRRPMIEIDGSTGGVGDVDDGSGEGKETLDALLRRFLAGVLQPEDTSTPIVWRIKASFGENAPHIREASRNTAGDILQWTRSGSPLRALFVISVGTIMLLALTGLSVFTFFFLIATFNAVIISFLVSLAAAGGLLAIFFACMAAIYVGALSVAVFAISTITIFASFSVLLASGWIGFFYIIWAGAKKTIELTKQSITVTGSMISSYSGASQPRG